MLPPLLQIDDALVSTELITEYFACDYEYCKGVCCIEGDSGAPMCDGEADTLRADYEKYKPLLSEEGIRSISEKGFSVIDFEGDEVTPLVDGTAECAYCHRHPEKGLMCAVEMAGCRKPVSCSLYPIRVQNLSNGMLALNLHHWSVCKCAFEKGRRENIRAYEFLRPVIERVYGEDFWNALDAARKEFDRAE